MIQTAAERVANYLQTRKVIEDDSREVIIYGMEILLSTALNIVAALALATVLGRVYEIIIFLMVFIFLRRYTGGYHAGTYLTCFLMFMAVLAILFALLTILPEELLNQLNFLFCLLSVAMVYRYAPMDHYNKPATPEERTRYRRISRISVTALAMATIAAAFIPGGVTLAFSSAYALAATGILLPAANNNTKEL